MLARRNYRAAKQARHFATRHGRIYDPSGQPFIPVGANIGARKTFDWNGYAPMDYQGIADNHSDDVLAWGWNAVRLNLLVADNQTWSYIATYGYGAFLDYVDSLVDEYTSKKIVVMLDAHDNPRIGDGSLYDHIMAQMVRFWTDAGIRYKDNPYVWFNLINEPDFLDGEWYDVNDTLARAARQNGAGNIMVVDAPCWGQDIAGSPSFPTAKFAYDPSMAPALAAVHGNLVLSQHNYGASQMYTTDQKLTTYIQTVQAAGLPLLFGEYGYTIDGSTTAGSYLRNLEGAQAVFNVSVQNFAGSFWWHSTHGDKYSLKNSGLSFFADGAPQNNLSPAGTALWSMAHGVTD